jgi:hypothetical protein
MIQIKLKKIKNSTCFQIEQIRKQLMVFKGCSSAEKTVKKWHLYAWMHGNELLFQELIALINCYYYYNLQ